MSRTKKRWAQILFSAAFVGILVAALKPAGTPEWAALLVLFAVCAALSYGSWLQKKEDDLLDAADKKDQETRADELALRKHEARLRVKADLRREKEERPSQSRLGPEHLKAFEKPEAPNGWREIEA